MTNASCPREKKRESDRSLEILEIVEILEISKWTRPFWGTDCRRALKTSAQPRQTPFAAPALRELESACRVSIF